MDTREVIRLNSDFLAREVQPLLDKKNLGYYNAKVRPNLNPSVRLCSRSRFSLF
jgi:hypothetical protein